MKSLEQEFGITLFHRQSRGLILTEEGEIILLYSIVPSGVPGCPDPDG
ncbi:LysR family transcriptional regulator [Clostridium sp. AM42-4]|nr:LysR family transcriptional regulator [Clostridium sp. AM42-4]